MVVMIFGVKGIGGFSGFIVNPALLQYVKSNVDTNYNIRNNAYQSLVG